MGHNRIVATQDDGTTATPPGQEPPDHRSGAVRAPAGAVLLRDPRASGCRRPHQPLCSAPTQVSATEYRDDRPAPSPRSPIPAARPADLAYTTVNGVSVPYIVRLERGTIDRAVYEIAALHDGGDPGPDRPGHRAGTASSSTRSAAAATAATTRARPPAACSTTCSCRRATAWRRRRSTSSNNNCSTIISAEAAMMVKEHFIESYGPIRFTIGWGGSGGAIQQYDIADAYPGILDGIIPGVSYPDPIHDARPGHRLPAAQPLLRRRPASTYTEDQMAAVSGFGSYHVCTSWDIAFANRITATDSCDPADPGRRPVGPGHQPGRRQVRRRRAGGEPARPRPGDGLRPQPARQRRRPVRTGRAARRRHRRRAVRRPQRAHRRARRRRRRWSPARSVADPQRPRRRRTATTWSTAAGWGWPGPRSSTSAPTSTTSRPGSPTSTPPSGATSCGQRMIEQGTVANQVIIESSPLQTGPWSTPTCSTPWTGG